MTGAIAVVLTLRRATAIASLVSLTGGVVIGGVIVGGVIIGGTRPAVAAPQTGPVTGLPLPRFVSLKSDRVNLHEGPAKDHRTVWIYQRAGLPVEITAEYDTWRKIRDADGTEGWVLHSLLSGRRTGMIPQKGAGLLLRTKPSSDAPATAKLENGVIGSVKTCRDGWCRLIGDGYDGWLEQSRIWGSYPGEVVE